MKKVFLIAVVLSAVCGHAQQHDVFDAEKYLQKKNSQKDTFDVQNYFQQKDNWNKAFDFKKKFEEKSNWKMLPLQRTNQPAWTLPDGNLVLVLPGDNMPCIVPDMSLYNYNMPVIKPTIVYTIPNPVYPPTNLPGITPEQLQKLMEKQAQPQH